MSMLGTMKEKRIRTEALHSPTIRLRRRTVQAQGVRHENYEREMWFELGMTLMDSCV